MRMMILAVVAGAIGFAQAPTEQLTFEVASVHPSAAAGLSIHRVRRSGGPGTRDPERFTCERCSLSSLLVQAFRIRSYLLSGPSWAIIYLTYLCLAGYAWGGVAGQSYGLGPTITQIVSSGDRGSTLAVIGKSTDANAPHRDRYGSFSLPDSDAMVNVLTKIVTPSALAPSMSSTGNPVGAGSITLTSASHPANGSPSRKIEANSKDSVSSRLKNTSAFPLGRDLRNSAKSCLLKIVALRAWPLRTLSSNCSACAWRSSASAMAICKSAVCFSALAARSRVSAITRPASSSARFADRSTKVASATSRNTPIVTSPSPMSCLVGHTPASMECTISGPPSINKPSTTTNPEKKITICNGVRPKPIFSLLVGPFIRRRRGQGRSVGIAGTIVTVILLIAFVFSALFILTR